MATSKRPALPQGKNTVAKRIEALPFLGEVDEMLLENTPAPGVARFIQDEKNELKNVDSRTLSKALEARRRQKQGTDGWWGVAPEGEQEVLGVRINYRRTPITPGEASKTIRERTDEGIRDMLELEATYLAQRDRVDRLIELESQTGAFGDITTKAMDSMTETLWKRIQARAKMNEGADSDLSVNLSIKNYSQRTVEVLSNPESRHRIMSLLERLTRFGKSKVPLPSVELALPQPSKE